MTESERQLVDLYLDGALPDSEHAVLFQHLETCPEAMDYLAARSQLNADLRRAFKRQKLQQIAMAGGVESSRRRQLKPVRSSWFSWRPITAAAAGLAIGLFGASVVFASITHRSPAVKRVSIPLENPGFESDLPDAPGNATSQTGIWTGGISGLTNGESGVKPVEGQSMLRVMPQGLKQNARIYQSIDLAEVSRDPIRELELSASFQSDSSAASHYYGVHLLAFDEPVVVDHQLHFSKLVEGSLATATQNLKVKVGEVGWRKVTVRMEVPPSASRLIICLSARAIGKDGSPANRYIDDVKLWAVSKSL